MDVSHPFMHIFDIIIIIAPSRIRRFRVMRNEYYQVECTAIGTSPMRLIIYSSFHNDNESSTGFELKISIKNMMNLSTVMSCNVNNSFGEDWRSFILRKLSFCNSCY